MTEVTLSAVCMNVLQDKTDNLEKYVHYIEEAASLGARLIIFQKCHCRVISRGAARPVIQK